MDKLIKRSDRAGVLALIGRVNDGPPPEYVVYEDDSAHSKQFEAAFVLGLVFCFVGVEEG